MKIFITLLLAIVIGGVGYTVLQNDNPKTTNTADGNSHIANGIERNELADLIIGDKNANATIIEYADFKCPTCNQFHNDAGQQLRNTYIKEGKLKIVFRPISIIGPDSERSAQGAYCANDQNKFLQYHDIVFDHLWDNYYKNRNYSIEFKDYLTTDKLVEIFKVADIDEVKFKDCLNKQLHKKNIDQNIKFASADEVQGTPTFKISGQIVTGAQSFNNFKTLVDLQLR